MMCSLFAGVSGLKNHQTRMDIIGNNIANVNTVGYKKSRVSFQEMLSQNLRGASSPTKDRGGINPIQVGLGMSLASIDVIHTSGSFESTGKNTDLAIEGEGFFVLGSGDEVYYTRAGNFDFDFNMSFYNKSNGMFVKGILADANGEINPKGEIVPINLNSHLSSRTSSISNFLTLNVELSGNHALIKYTSLTIPSYTANANSAFSLSLPTTHADLVAS